MTLILIAEDEPRISSFVRRGLESAGFTAEVVENGDDALERALSGDVDLLLLDVGLPGLDGFEVLRNLRGQGSNLPVIMLTARS
ncbi:MAG: copR, partial [Microbacterium sp.]|nr:copR [Microbacterium sp.]